MHFFSARVEIWINKFYKIMFQKQFTEQVFSLLDRDPKIGFHLDWL